MIAVAIKLRSGCCGDRKCSLTVEGEREEKNEGLIWEIQKEPKQVTPDQSETNHRIVLQPRAREGIVVENRGYYHLDGNHSPSAFSGGLSAWVPHCLQLAIAAD